MGCRPALAFAIQPGIAVPPVVRRSGDPPLLDCTMPARAGKMAFVRSNRISGFFGALTAA
jgi:hypothetical protein